MLGKYFEVYNKKTYKIATLSIFALIAGSYAGYLKSSKQAKIASLDSSLQNIQNYESEDSINSVIQNTKKPAVVYYYQPGVMEHYILRHAMIQCSNRYKDNASFWMVNLTKKLQMAKQQIRMNFPINKFLIQIRFPKDQCEVKYSSGEIVLEQNVNRRQFFKHQYYSQQGLQSFLEQNGIKPPHDPLSPLFNINYKAIFNKKYSKKQ